MDASWFLQALEQAGHSQADLARHLGLQPSAISRMLKGERQMKLLEAVKIAQFLRVSQEEVMRHAGEASDPHAGQSDASGAGRRRGQRGRPPQLERGGDRLPIRSAARGGSEQEMFLEDGPIGYTPRPANLEGVRAAYAIYMLGDSMEPRYAPGWLLHVNPFKPPTRGRDVVVYKKNNTVLIKQFVGWEERSLVLRQLNPDQQLRIPREEVAECHLIVGSDQEG